MKKPWLAWAAFLLISSVAALPAGAQSINWDNGTDLLNQFNPKSQAVVPVPAPKTKAAGKLIAIDAVETIVGKFHRYDNQVHPYDSKNFWIDFIGSGGGLSSTPARDNADGSVTIEFADLKDLLQTVVAVAKRENAQVAVLNIHAHGLPGGTWFPKDKQTMRGSECSQWLGIAQGQDKDSYNQYYTGISWSEIMEMRMIATRAGGHYDCVTGADDWRSVASGISGLSAVFAPGAQVHFDSCLVGLGAAGEAFIEGVAGVLFPHGGGNVAASLDYGLGDWSMPNGMGFWDYQNTRQLASFNKIYPVDHKDSEVKQKGTVRVANWQGGAWTTFLMGNLDTMPTGGAKPQPTAGLSVPVQAAITGPMPTTIRIPGTTVYTPVR